MEKNFCLCFNRLHKCLFFLGRIFNVLGESVDKMGLIDYSKTLPIHRSAPSFVDLDTQLSIFETGIKVVDLLAPYRRGGKIGLFGGAGVGKTVLIMEVRVFNQRIIIFIN